MRPIGNKVRAACAVALGVLGMIAEGAEYPNRPVRVVVPYSAGGTADIVTRLYADQLQKRLGQPFVIEAKPGADSIIGTEAVVKAPPDGYTLLGGGVPAAVILPIMYRSVPFDVERDLVHVAGLSENAYIFVINTAVPATTLQEFIAYARANPGKLNHSQPGGQFKLDWAVFKRITGLDIVEVPYKGAAPAIAAIAANQTQVHMSAPGNIKAHIEAGRLRALAATGERRNPAMPSVPSMTEAGLPAFGSIAALAILAHSRMPADVINRLNAELTAIAEMPQVQERLLAFGFDPPKRLSSEALNRQVHERLKAYREAARFANITPE